MAQIIHGEKVKRLKNFNNYVISESGRVYRDIPVFDSERRLLNSNQDLNYITEIKPQTAKYRNVNYKYIVFNLVNSKGKRTCVNGATLVCETFGIKKVNPGDKISYKDGNYKNISVDNICFYKSKRQKLSANDVIQIKQMLKNGLSLSRIAHKFGVSDMQISRIKNRVSWNCI